MGKGLLINACGSLFGDGFKRVNNAQASSQFKSSQLGATFVFFDEATNSPSAAQRADMNSFITEPIITVNQKFQPEIDVRNMMNGIYTTNKPDAWTIEKYDRRRYVIENTGAPREPEFYESFAKWWGKPESKRAAMYFFMHRDLSDYKPHRAPPMIAGKSEMQRNSSTDLENFLRDFVSDLREDYALWEDKNNSKQPKKIYVLKELVDLYMRSYINAKSPSEVLVSKILRSMGFFVNRRVSVAPAKRFNLFSLINGADWDTAENDKWAAEYNRKV